MSEMQKLSCYRCGATSMQEVGNFRLSKGWRVFFLNGKPCPFCSGCVASFCFRHGSHEPSSIPKDVKDKLQAETGITWKAPEE